MERQVYLQPVLSLKRHATTPYIIEMQSFQIQIKRNPIKTIANTNYKGFDK